MPVVVFVGKEKGETEQYTKESQKLMQLFFAHSGVPNDATISSDDGNAFYEDGVRVLEQVVFKNS